MKSANEIKQEKIRKLNHAGNIMGMIKFSKSNNGLVWYPDLPYVRINGELGYHPHQWFIWMNGVSRLYGIKAGPIRENGGCYGKRTWGLNAGWRIDYIRNNGGFGDLNPVTEEPDKMPLNTFGDLLELMDFFEISFRVSGM